jgi:hypothetical protein
VAAVREGMAKVIPVPLLSLFSGYELETMVCGSPDIPLNLLKSVATYKGKDSFFCMSSIFLDPFDSLLLCDLATGGFLLFNSFFSSGRKSSSSKGM